MKTRMRRSTLALLTALILMLGMCGCTDLLGTPSSSAPTSSDNVPSHILPYGIPDYNGQAYVTINGNIPQFTEKTTTAYEQYAALDSLGRCGVVQACCGTEIMPAPGEERGSISAVYPSGWKQATYDFISGKYLYNRCHLIGWQLSAENANKSNLITGTKYLNIQGMLPFENMVADYIHDTGNHVMYRITPFFYGDELVARGVQMEAYSVEDEGDGICFNVFCYNVQPGVVIDYANGSSYEQGTAATSQQTATTTANGQKVEYILNISSKRIHYPHCSAVAKMSESNKQSYSGEIQTMLSQGYVKCGICMAA